MKSAIDRSGRVVVPKALRDELRIGEGAVVEIYVREGRIVIEPVATPMTLVDRGRGRVAVPEDELPTLTADDVRAVVESQRR